MEYKLFEEFITLQALLKDLGIIQSGGAIKSFLADHLVYFNGELKQDKIEKERVAKLVKEMNKKVQKKPDKKNQPPKVKSAPRFPGR